MSRIRTTRKLPSGISGWYIYYDVNGKLFISSPQKFANMFHTKEDVEFIIDILNESLINFT